VDSRALSDELGVGDGSEEGKLTFWFGDEDHDWTSNQSSYDFGELEQYDVGVKIWIVKHPDGQLGIDVGVHDQSFRHEQPATSVPTGPDPLGRFTHGMCFSLVWNPKFVVLHLGGRDAIRRVVTFQR